MNNRREITLVVALCMACSVLGAEWTWDYSGGGFFWLRATSRIGPSLCLLWFGMNTGAFRTRSGARKDFAMVGGLLVLGSLLFQKMVDVSDVEKQAVFDYSLLGAIQAVLCGFMGYWIAQDEQEIGWLFRRIALACALGSLLGGCTRAAGLEAYPFIVPTWPARLVFLFGYCWYLHQWLISQPMRLGGLLGVAACSAEVWISFHKPIVFSASVASVFLCCYSLWTTRRPAIILQRMAALVVLATTAFVVVNAITSGRLVSQVEEIVYERFLHQLAPAVSGAGLSGAGLDLELAAGGRYDLWTVAVARFKAHPLFGSGFGQSISGTVAGFEGVYLHNWYLDYLVSLGIVGTIPIFAALLWWLKLVTNRKVISRAGNVVVPCLSYIVGLMAYNLGGSIRAFFSMTSFAVLVMAIVARMADRALAPTSSTTDGQSLLRTPVPSPRKPNRAGRPSPRALVHRQRRWREGETHD